jgi:tetratricopeptide (TPR) repeat protein
MPSMVEAVAPLRLELPGYAVEREIGRGGMARVYLAVQKKFGRLVALKVVSPEFTSDPSFGKRFAREARIIGQLNHPNIVQVHDAGVHENCYYLVMEYLRGGDLNRRLAKGLHMQAVLSVIKDVARALDYAHQKGYVHRDIKPENILFREDGSAVLSDFGIAKVVSAGVALTRQGSVVGTPQYMSPEQAAGRALDGRSDLYSLGVVFFRMLSGDVPYKADSAVAIGVRHLQDPIPRLPSHLAPFQDVVDRFLAKKPEDRFQSGAEVIEALDRTRADGVVPNNVVKTEVVTTAEIRAVSDAMPDGLEVIRAEPGAYRKNQERSSRTGLWWALLIVAAVAIALTLYPDRGRMVDQVLFATGLAENPDLGDAWREAQSLQADPNQSLASVVAGYRRVLSIEPTHIEAQAAIADLATRWKTDIQAALDVDDLPLAEAKLSQSLAVFPLDVELTALFEALGDQQRALSLFTSTQALLRSHGIDDLPSATAAIQAYKEVLRLDPDNAAAAAELDVLAAHYSALADGAVDSGDVVGAMNYIERATTANQEYAGLTDVRDKIRQATTTQEEIQGLLQQASAYRANGALINPPGENAAEIYDRVLATDPDNAIANQGLSELVGQLLAQATQLLDSGQILPVRDMLDRATAIGLSDAAIGELQTRLDREQRVAGDVARLLEEARTLLNDGFITEPQENNAVARLSEVLRLDPDNVDARKELQRAAQRLAAVAQEAFDVGFTDDASHYLELALTVTPEVPEWRELREVWLQKAFAANDATPIDRSPEAGTAPPAAQDQDPEGTAQP